MPDDDFDAIEKFLPELLPDGAIPISGVLVVEFLNEEGETEHTFLTLGGTRVIHAIGLLETGKLMLWDDAHEEDNEDA